MKKSMLQQNAARIASLETRNQELASRLEEAKVAANRLEDRVGVLKKEYGALLDTNRTLEALILRALRR